MARQINYIVFHCTAGPQTQSVEDIKAYWKSKGWKNPGYHIMIDAAGTIHRLQPIDKISNGVAGYNKNAVHCSYIGGIDQHGRAVDNRTAEQLQSMEQVLNEWHALLPNAVICGHRDFSPDKNRNGKIEPGEWIKSCPSFEVKDWLAQIGFKSQAAAPMLRTTTRVNLREGEGLHFKVVKVLNSGIPVKRLATGNDWVYVSAAGVTGWISERFLE
jgi:N-acetylmuramoyl-L-alanine amidase